MTDAQIEQFMTLFAGSKRSFGQWNPDTGQMFTKKTPPTREDFESHLLGRTGIGIVPVVDDKFSQWGAIDIDDDNIDHSAVEAQISEEGLPLLVCRSKSGGAHLYLFLAEAIPTSGLRTVLADYAKRLGFGGCEVFPKQNETNKDILGNWINLPYFAAKDSKRYAIIGGKPATFDYFLETATNHRTSRADLPLGIKEHGDAPPCIQAMIQNGVGPGMRNEAMYNIAIYLKRAFPENFKEKAFDINSGFIEPLPHAEARTVINSVARRDYLYKCKSEPCRSLCDSNTCVTRKFGITPSEKSTIVDVETPVFANLRKYTTEPVYWELDVNGSSVRVATAVLMDYRKFREAVADAQTRLIPNIKNADWLVLLEGLMQTCILLEAPDEASAPGQVRAKLMEFLQRANKTDKSSDRQNLLRGMPVLEDKEGKTTAIFRGEDFREHLKRTRSEVVQGAQLWLALRKLNVKHTRIRVGGSALPVWVVELDEQKRPVMDTPNFQPEF